MNIAMNTAEKVDFEFLVWISATNDLTAVVQMYELSQYVTKNINRVWVINFMSKNLWRIDFGTDLNSFMNICSIISLKVRK